MHGYNIIERLAYYGISSNLINYLTFELCEGTSESAKNVNNWIGVSYLASIIGAFVSDAYLGRFRATVIMSIVYILGLTSLTLLEVLRPFQTVPCDIKNSISTIQAASIYISLYLISIGIGVVRTLLGAFGADQFEDTDPVERRGKSSFFNWWSFGMSSGSLLAFTIVLYIQDNVGWGASFGIITVTMIISVILFFAATSLYRMKPPIGSPFTGIVQVLVAAVCNRNVKVPENCILLYETHDTESIQRGRRKLFHTNEFGFLDKAATKHNSKHSHSTPNEELHASLIVDEEKNEDGFDASVSPWKLCSVTQVEEVKLIARIIPIWTVLVVFFVSVVQALTLFTKQGMNMDRKITSNFTIPAASLLSVSMIVIIVLLPIYDRIFVSIARWLTGNEQGITTLQRLGVGMFFSIIMMVAAALAEKKRLNVAEQYALMDDPNATIPITVFWLVPQYVLYGLTYVFSVVGQQEFLYDQMPDSMASMGMALCMCSFGAASFLSSFLITIVDTITSKYGGGQSWFQNNINRCHFDYFYWLIAVICTLNLCVYLWLARSHVYKKIA